MKLSPICDILIEGDRTISLGELPWMRIETPAEQWAGRWVRLVYDASLVAPLTRPLLRAMQPGGYEDFILPAPVFGRGIWIGLIPAGATELRLSPVDWIGPFAFRIVSLTAIGLPGRLAAGMRRYPRITLHAFAEGLRGHRAVGQSKMRRALGATPLAHYRRWRAARARSIEWHHLDSLSAPAQRISLRIVVVHDGEEGRGGWERFVASQPLQNVSLSWVGSGSALAGVLDAFDDDDLIIGLRHDDRLADFSLAAVAEHCAKDPAVLFYADEENDGYPILKPDWSPVLARFGELVGRAWFARIGWLRTVLPDTAVAGALLSQLPMTSIDRAVHIRRVLLSTTAKATLREPRSAVAAPVRAQPPGGQLQASIIIPTRDRLDLLAPCIQSLINNGSALPFEIIIVDNGSVQPETLAFFEEISKDERISIIFVPETFNFSALCNKASHQAGAEILIFLNNDTEILSGDWLSLLVGWAEQPDIGAVGAKLLYGDGTLQHGGAILGIGGGAAHFERKIPASEPGFFGRLSVPHELSAVTAACLAVSKSKFHAVGGFDERNLPIDLNDIDLCLRLGERGWRTILDPRALLRHHESASRGKARPSEILYKKEIAYFRERWLHLLRNDPYFHPALSLETQRPALG
ncbi:glycosyltransferase family 2 protein [Labrys neptuniae]